MRLSRLNLYVCLACLWMASSVAVATEVYRWTDAEGHVHFGNRPPQKNNAEFLFKSKPQPTKSGSVKRKKGRVTKVTDGDTVVLANNYRLRLAGINAPEVAQAGKPGQRGGEAARQYLEQLLAEKGTGAAIEYEFAEQMRDRYGRYLVHLFNKDGTKVNARLLEEGLVHASITPPNLKYMEEYLAAEKQARDARRGIWAHSDYRTFNSNEIQDSRNQFRRVKMTVTTLENDAEHHILQSSDGFSVRIPKKDLPSFNTPNAYLGKTLIVRGWVKMRRNKLYIEVRHPLQIEVIPNRNNDPRKSS